MPNMPSQLCTLERTPLSSVFVPNRTAFAAIGQSPASREVPIKYVISTSSPSWRHQCIKIKSCQPRNARSGGGGVDYPTASVEPSDFKIDASTQERARRYQLSSNLNEFLDAVMFIVQQAL